MRRIKRIGISICLFLPALSGLADNSFSVNIKAESEYKITDTVVLTVEETCNEEIGPPKTYTWISPPDGSGSSDIRPAQAYGIDDGHLVSVDVTIASQWYSETQNGYTNFSVVEMSVIGIADGSSQPIPPGGNCRVKVSIDPGNGNHSADWKIVNRIPDPDQPPEAVEAFNNISIGFDGQSGREVFGRITVPEESGTGTIRVRATESHLSDYFEELDIRIECVCSACQVGSDCNLACSINSGFMLGKSMEGQAGKLKIEGEVPTPSLAQPVGLKAVAVSRDVEVILQPVLGTNAIRQVLAPECLADVVATNSFGYDLNFYRRENVNQKDTNGLYQLTAGAIPFVSYRIKNPAGTTNDISRLRITKNRGGLITVVEYSYQVSGGEAEWSLSTGNGLRTETISKAAKTNGYVVTRTVKDSAQTVASKKQTTFQIFDFGTRMVEEITDPDGAALRQTADYWQAPVEGQYGKLRSVVNADGSWKRYDYDEEGRRIEEGSSWLNAGANATADQARAVYYSYEPVYQYYLTTNMVVTNGMTNAVVVTNEADNGVLYAALPRITTEKILGQVVRKTFNAYYALETGERVEIEEQAGEASASYGDPSNLRTVKAYYPLATGEPDSGKLKSVLLPDGRRESYYYEKGDYAGEIFSLGTGDYECVTTVQGTESSPDGINRKTTASRTVTDPLGRIVLEETQVYANGNYERIAWTTYTYDSLGHLIRVDKSNGTYSESTWGCCGKESERDENGVERVYAYDALQRLEFSKKVGVAAGEFPAQADQITTYTYDAAGWRLTETLSAGSLSQGRTNQYDLAGRLIESTDFAGLRTITSYSQDGLITTKVLPGGLVPPSAGFTRITERYKDGQIKAITGTAQINQYYEYGINADGTRWTKVYSASNNSPVWVKTTTDLLGRTAKVEKPGYLTTEVTENVYNNLGQLIKTTTTGKPDTLNAYDEMGNQIRSGLDVNANGVLDFAGTDRISESDTSYNLISGIWYLESASRLYATDNSAGTITNSITRQRLTGLGGSLATATVSIDPLGNATITTTTIDRDAKKVTQTTDVPDSSANIVRISVNGLVQSRTSKSGITTTFAYDSLGRRTRSETVGGTRSVASVSHYDSHGWLDYTEDAAGNRTAFTYDPATGRQLSLTDPLSNTTYFSYTSYGKEEKTWGSAAYPVAYEYDSYGRMVKMHTYRGPAAAEFWNGAGWPANPGTADTTEWIYHEASGLLLAKKDAAGKQVSYTYTGNLKLETRNWARTDGTNSLVTTYTYNSAGDLIGIDYSDNTPDVSFTYDRLGRQKTASSSVSSHTFAYNGFLLDSETIVSSAGTNVIDRSYDSLGRSFGFNLNSDYQVFYGYDSLGRFSSVSSACPELVEGAVNYSYLANSDLISALTVGGVGDPALSVTRSYEPNRNLLTQIKNSVDSQTISQFDYANDSAGRRTAIKYSGSAFSTGPAFNKYDYNSRSEVIVGDKFWGTDINHPDDPVLGQAFAYAYDNIGNRTTSSRDNEEMVYTANSLNQYLQRTIPDGIDILGSAETNTTVTVNDLLTSRHEKYWHRGLDVTNDSSAAYQEVNVVGVYNPPGTNEPDVVSSETGHVFVAKTPEQFTYDADGNLLQDGRFNYSWDCENRLIAVETRSNLVGTAGPAVRLEFQYDYMSRRISNQVSNLVNGQWSIVSSHSFVYDGWNVIREINQAAGLGKIVDDYVWGLDLSGSLQGAGGIGGLLGRVRTEYRYYDLSGKLIICHRPPGNPDNCKTIRINESAWPAHLAHGDSLGSCAGGTVSSFLYTFDANGNVSELLQPSAVSPPSSVVVGHYEYSPFGETIVSTGPEALDNPFRFSTKYFVDELGIGDWGRRWYTPPLGRWLSSDPLGESGGKNLYVFCNNNALKFVDKLGFVLAAYTEDPYSLVLQGELLPVEYNGVTLYLWGPDLPDLPATVDGDKVSIGGSLQIFLYYNKNNANDPDTYIGEDGASITAHEQNHADSIAGYWNDDLKAEIDPLEGNWCPSYCAVYVQAYANAASAYIKAQAYRSNVAEDYATLPSSRPYYWSQLIDAIIAENARKIEYDEALVNWLLVLGHCLKY